MILYQVQNNHSGNRYYGITGNMKRRMAAHRYRVQSGSKTKFYDAVRSYGWDSFTISILEEGEDSYISSREIELIASDPDCYNLHLGGHIGFDVSTKPAAEVEAWKAKLREGRKGKTPAKGMSHSEETKKLCSAYAKLRWDMSGRYPDEVLDVGFTEANKKCGISKTHYYRLRTRQQANDLL